MADYSYQYDLDGNLSQSTDADGNVNTYSYDSLNRETGETMDNGDGSVNTNSFSYDVEGNLLSAANTYAATTEATANSVAAYTYQYDTVGNMTDVTARLGSVASGEPIQLASGYDYNGNRTSLTATIGDTPDFANTYVYDALGNMTNITQSEQSIYGANSVAYKQVELGYDYDSRLTSVDSYSRTDPADPYTLYQAVAASYTYDNDARLTDLSYTAQSSTLAAYHWSYDNGNEVTDAYSYSDTSDGVRSNVELHDLGRHELHLR